MDFFQTLIDRTFTEYGGLVAFLLMACGFMAWRLWKKDQFIQGELVSFYDRYEKLATRQIEQGERNTAAINLLRESRK